MSTPEASDFRLERSTILPSQHDFDPHGGCLDARKAWKHFGGLSLQQAFDLFLTNPLYYQEDFMFMGSGAFEYYLPVIDRFLRETPGGPDEDGRQAAILGSGVALQFDWNGSKLSKSLVSEVEALSAFVQSDLNRFSTDPEEQRRVAKEWSQVDAKIIQFRNSSELGGAANAAPPHR